MMVEGRASACDWWMCAGGAGHRGGGSSIFRLASPETITQAGRFVLAGG